jgi:hypothetical protein
MIIAEIYLSQSSVAVEAAFVNKEPDELTNWRWSNVAAQISKTPGKARTQCSTR